MLQKIVFLALFLFPIHAELILHYTFDNIVGNTVIDDSNDGINNNGTIQGGAVTAAAIDGNGLNLNGLDQFIDNVLNLDIDVDVIPEFTFSMFVQPRDLTRVQSFISHDDGGFDRQLGIDNRDGGVAGFNFSAFTGAGVVEDNSASIVANQFFFIAGTYSQSTNTVTFFVSDAAPGSRFSQTTATTFFNGGGVSNNIFNIGRNPLNGGQEFFDGIIDDVKIFNTALSEAELTAERDNPGAVPEPSTYLLLILLSVFAFIGKKKLSVLE